MVETHQTERELKLSQDTMKKELRQETPKTDIFRKHGSHRSQMAVSFTKCEHTRISEEKLAVPSVSISGYKIMLAPESALGRERLLLM